MLKVPLNTNQSILLIWFSGVDFNSPLPRRPFHVQTSALQATFHQVLVPNCGSVSVWVSKHKTLWPPLRKFDNYSPDCTQCAHVSCIAQFSCDHSCLAYTRLCVVYLRRFKHHVLLALCHVVWVAVQANTRIVTRDKVRWYWTFEIVLPFYNIRNVT